MRTWFWRLAGLIGQKRRDRDLDDEVRFHIDMLAADFERRGMTAEDARRAARRHFGAVTQMKEAYRDQRGIPALESFVQDGRYALRTLWRAPGFTIAALLTVALGIGANAAIFSVVNAVLLRPLPYAEPERLVQFVRQHPTGPAVNQDGARYLFFRDNLRSIEALAAYSGAGSFNLVNGDRAEFVSALAVSKEYFAAFRVQPFVGQAFTAEHDRVGGPDVAILTHALWWRQFAGDPGAIGRSILLGDRPFTVIGVMPGSFQTTSRIDLLLPLRTSTGGRGGGFNYGVTGRLKPTVSLEQANAEAAAAWRAFADQNPQRLIRNELPSGFVPLQQSVARDIRPALLMMLAAVGLLLLIACANTANLLLARASGRGREIAMRAALGAGRGRIIRQLLTESVLLFVAGGCAGILFAYWTVPTLLSMTPPGFLATNQEVRMDAVVVTVSLAVAIATGVLFGLAPALTLSRHDLVEAFKEDARTTAGRRSGLLRKALVAGEVAMCMLLLVGAALLIRTFINLTSVDPGFDPRGVLTARMSMQGDRYSKPADINRFYDEGLAGVRRLPGVRSAAVASGLPIDRALNLNVDVLDGPENERVQDALIDWRYITTDYFATMGIAVVAGRGFTEADSAGAPRVAVVSEEFAKRFFKATPAIGRHIRVFEADGSMEIVGIVKNLKEGGLKGPVLPVMYVPVTQTHAGALRTTHTFFQVNWVVRADTPGPGLARQIEEQIRAVDPRQPVSAFRTMEEVKAAAIAIERFQMTLLGAFAFIGLMLATAGVYGLLAYSVAQRTREFAIRLALGATRQDILLSVVRGGTALAMLGIAIGLVSALALTRVLQGFVWGVSTLDPATFIVVALTLIMVAALASLVPAMRAVRLNPVTALRE